MNLSPELTREFRGLKLWLPLKLLGVAPFRAALDEKLALAQHAASAIEAAGVPGLRVVSPPELSIFTFKLDGDDGDPAAVDALNVELLKRVHAKGNVLLSPFRSVSGTDGEVRSPWPLLLPPPGPHRKKIP